jgi:DNA-binding GntR family transcriptional regulator
MSTSTGGQSQGDLAYQLIKRDILTCVLEPNSRITETEFAERYGLGRASVRTALSRLSHEALVEVLPRYGYVIAPQTIRDARDLFELQRILEPAAARITAGRIDAQYITELDEDCEAFRQVTNAEEATAFLHANTKFHVAVAASTGNVLMARFVRILFERLERFLHSSSHFTDVVREVAHSHNEVVEHLIGDDPEAAAQAVHDSLAESHKIILDAFAKYDRIT